MGAIPGRDLRIKYKASGGTAVAIAGSKSDGLTVNQGMIEATDKDDAGVRRLLDAIATWSLSGQLSGVLKGTTLIDLVADPTASPLKDFEIEIPNIGTWAGKFFITSLETTGEDGENPVQFSCQIESDGLVTWTAAA